MTRARLLQLVNLTFWALVLGASVWYVVPKWRTFELSSRLETLIPGWLSAAIVLLAIQYLAVFAIWRRLFGLLGSPAPSGALFRAFAFSLLPKYIPGRVFGVGLRARVAAEAGIPYSIVLCSMAWELGFGIISAAAITGFGLVFGGIHELEPAAQWLVVALPGAALLGLGVMQLPRLRELLSKWLHFEAGRRRTPALLVVFLCYCGSWLLYAAAHWMLARAIAPFPAEQWFPLLVALAASWALGMLSLVAPAGLGVREGALFVFARPLMGTPDALLFVTLSRLAIFAVEAILTAAAVVVPADRLRPRLSADASHP